MGAELIRVAVIEDHPIVRDAFASVVVGAPDLALDVTAGSVEEFERTGSKPDIVLLDLLLPGGGLERSAAVEHLANKGHRVLVITSLNEAADVIQTMAAGAHGYITKSVKDDELLQAVRIVARGQKYIQAAVESQSRRAPAHLSPQQTEILALLATGMTDREIAKHIRRSVKTVQNQVARVRDATGARRRAELTRWAIEHGITVQSD